MIIYIISQLRPDWPIVSSMSSSVLVARIGMIAQASTGSHGHLVDFSR